MVNGKMWLSPGARLGFAITACVVALLIIFVAVPFYANRADQEQKVKAAEIVRQQQERAGQELLHHFDCTYGVGVRFAIREARDNQRRMAAISLTSIHAAQALNDPRHLHTARLARQNALRSAERYDQILRSLKPLDGIRPC